MLLAGRYTLLEHRALDDLLPACAERGVSVLAAAIFNSGMLATPRPPRTRLRLRARLAGGAASVRSRIADVCEAHGVTLPEAAMAFPLPTRSVAGIIVGMRSAEEVRRNIASFEAEIPPQLWADLRGEGLLDERAPVP